MAGIWVENDEVDPQPVDESGALADERVAVIARHPDLRGLPVKAAPSSATVLIVVFDAPGAHRGDDRVAAQRRIAFGGRFDCGKVQKLPLDHVRFLDRDGEPA